MNKKGFTLAELLGVIVILLLLVLIATPIVINYTKKASDSVYDVQVKTIKTSAKEWASDKNNFKLLPTEDNECVEVSIEKLKEAGYLDYNIKNPKTNEKFDDDLTVIIRKEGNSLTYDFNEDGTQVCSTIITTDYPKWILVSSNPTLATLTNEITINIESSKKISEYNLTADNIIVKAGSTINDNANILVNCTNGEKLSCEVKISDIEGDGRLILVIDKNVMKDEDLNPSRKTSIQTDTTVDTNGPKISYTGRTNTNASTYYATKDDEVTIKFKAEDNQNITNNLTANDIKVYLDGIEVDCTKELTVTGSGKSLSYALKLTNVTGSGKVSIKVPSGKVLDSLGNVNNDKTLMPGIIYDNNNPVITFEPNGEARYLQSITPTINVSDDETGVDEDTIKYIISANNNATPNVPISNGGEITIKDVTGSYYIIGYACDYAGNCGKVASEVYHMNNEGPVIEINPAGNSGYAKTENIKIKVTAAGTALDEGSFAYALSTDSSAEPDTTFINNENINIPLITGEYYVIARACDMDSNCSLTISNKFYFDNSAPEIKYTPDGTDNTWKKSQNVTIEATDNVELDWSKYIVSTDKTATPNVAITNGSLTTNLTGLTGEYYIVAKACDKLNNCTMINSNKYYFDNTAPGIGNISVTPNASTMKITSAVTITDNVALKKYEIYNPSGTKDVEQNISGTSYNVSYVQNARGTYKLRVYDHLDNYTDKSFTIPGYTVTFNVNNTSMGSVTSGSVTVDYGATASTTFTPKSGYKYKSVSSGCSVSGTTVSKSSVTAAATCTVTFEAACSFTSKEFTYTGAMQSWTVPCDGTYQLEVWGGQGASASCWADIVPGAGGKGGYSKGNKVLTKDTVLYIGVGGGGGNLFNGAGQGDSRYGGHGGHGGGGTHIGTQNAQISGTTASNLIIVAGGGGGGVCYNHAGGAGGGTNGSQGSGGSYADNNGRGGYGGSQTAGGAQFSTSSNSEGWVNSDPGSYGKGGLGIGVGNTFGGAGGGGGYYGGGGGLGNGFQSAGAGGGGSGYIGGVTNGSMTNGQRSGNGYAKITRIS